ncbi:MAG: S9 family peptidase, partial [Acidimicrobiaceae bacterium]|nr:S9 family peptidase [Acidimicrobiaceae bacterium]
FGQSTYTFLADGRLVATWRHPDGLSHIGLVGDAGVEPWDLPFSQYDSLAGADGAVTAVVGSSTHPPAVVRISGDDGRAIVLRASRQVRFDTALISKPRLVTYPSGGETSRAWYYPPTNPAFAAPAGQRPPLVVMSHGGPTSSTLTVLNLAVQYWTSRGFAVADVDYRGSAGYGRDYRDRLRGEWGVLDVEDCAAVVAHLAGEGLADGARAVIRGGSAGGFTTLAALCFTDVFAAGASLYGVADLELLARDTHKFEARYLDGLVGPWPEAEERYRERSPLYHLDGLRCPVILFQGEEDAVVPRSQADAIYAALKDRGVPVAYLLFAGEQHGFRQAATIEAVAEAELAFYGRVLGFSPAGDPRVPPIENEKALNPRS